MRTTLTVYDLIIFSRLTCDERLAKNKLRLLNKYLILNGFDPLRIRISKNETETANNKKQIG